MTDPAQPALVWSGYTGYRDTLYTPNTPQHPPGSQWLTHNNHEKTLGTGRGSRAGGKLTIDHCPPKRGATAAPLLPLVGVTTIWAGRPGAWGWAWELNIVNMMPHSGDCECGVSPGAAPSPAPALPPRHNMDT